MKAYISLFLTFGLGIGGGEGRLGYPCMRSSLAPTANPPPSSWRKRVRGGPRWNRAAAAGAIGETMYLRCRGTKTNAIFGRSISYPYSCLRSPVSQPAPLRHAYTRHPYRQCTKVIHVRWGPRSVGSCSPSLHWGLPIRSRTHEVLLRNKRTKLITRMRLLGHTSTYGSAFGDRTSILSTSAFASSHAAWLRLAQSMWQRAKASWTSWLASSHK